MIFAPEEAKKILARQKTQTRRLIKNDANIQEELTGKSIRRVIQYSPGYPGGRVKWEVGKTYAVQPDRGKPALWVNYDHPCYDIDIWENITTADKEIAAKQGYQPGRIKITRIRAEQLQNISGADAVAEGIDLYQSGRFWILSRDDNAVLAYMTLWNSLHTKKGTRWEDNPEVWVIEFELVDSTPE